MLASLLKVIQGRKNLS